MSSKWHVGGLRGTTWRRAKQGQRVKGRRGGQAEARTRRGGVRVGVLPVDKGRRSCWKVQRRHGWRCGSRGNGGCGVGVGTAWSGFSWLLAQAGPSGGRHACAMHCNATGRTAAARMQRACRTSRALPRSAPH